MNNQSEYVYKKSSEIFDIDNGVKYVNEKIRELMIYQTKPILINIAGGSASGKTSKVTEEIIKSYKDNISRITMDDYYKGKTYMESEKQKGNHLNWDEPNAIDINLIKEHIDLLKKGEKIQKPIYSMKISEPIGEEEIRPSRIILLEGLFSLSEELIKNSELKIFIEADETSRLIRRVLRDKTRTGQDTQEIINYFYNTIEPMHKKYIESTKINSDVIIKNHLNIENELLNNLL